MTPNPLRIVLAFLLAPIGPALIFTLLGSALDGSWNGTSFALVAFIAVCFGIELVVGVPTYLVLRRRREITKQLCFVAGALLGLLPTVLAFLIPLPGYSAGDGGGTTIINGTYTLHGQQTLMFSAALQAGIGAIVGLAFWVLSGHRASRPNNSLERSRER